MWLQTTLYLALQISNKLMEPHALSSDFRQTADHAADSPASNPTEGPIYPSPL